MSIRKRKAATRTNVAVTYDEPTPTNDPASFTALNIADKIRESLNDANVRVKFLTEEIDTRKDEREALYRIVNGLEQSLGFNSPQLVGTGSKSY
jgi:hypothetical protein